MIVNITIPTPVLVTGEYFRVRHRMAGTTTWTNDPNQTNAPFTLNLTVGNWEVEFTLVKADGTICPSVIKPLTVVDPTGGGGSPYTPLCLTVDSIAIVNNGLYATLEVAYSGATNPCGYEFIYAPMPGLGGQLLQLPNVPSPLSLPIQQGINYLVQIWAIGCDNTRTLCFEDEVIAPGTGSCTPSVLDPVEIISAGQNSYLKFTFLQSSPATTSFGISWAQTNVATAGVPDLGGTQNVAVTPSQTVILIPISPNYNAAVVNSNPVITYSGSFTDKCESKYWTVSFELT